MSETCANAIRAVFEFDSIWIVASVLYWFGVTNTLKAPITPATVKAAIRTGQPDKTI